MARSEQKTKAAVALTVSTQNLEAFDITSFSGVCVSIIGPSGGAGTLKLQRSNDGTNWVDISGASMTLSSGFALVDVSGVHAAQIRPVVTLSAGAGSYDVKYLAKDF